MTAERVFILVVAVAVGAAAAAMRNWWSFAGMVVLVLRVAYEAWRRRPTRAPRVTSGTEPPTDVGTRAGN